MRRDLERFLHDYSFDRATTASGPRPDTGGDLESRG